MIICHSEKFILLSINKVATTSSHFILNQFVKDIDVTSGYHDDTDANFLLDEQSMPKNIPTVTYNEFIEKSEVKVDYMPLKVGEDPVIPNKALESLYLMGDKKVVLDMLAKNTFKHSTPTELIRWNLIDKNILESYSIYGFIREPIQRALSAFFFEKFFHKVETSPKDVGYWIDSLFDSGPTVFMGKKYKNYFQLEGNKIADPLDYANYYKELQKIVEKHKGKMPETMPTFKSGCRPVWSREHIKTWLDNKHISRLEQVLSEDIEFYNHYFN